MGPPDRWGSPRGGCSLHGAGSCDGRRGARPRRPQRRVMDRDHGRRRARCWHHSISGHGGDLGSGSDGVHIIILGGPDRTQADFDALLSSACGFTEIHPRFDPVHGTPASSPRTLTQILDDLPDGYLAIAPHALNDNGVASADTVRGNLRWKALHHDRLAAIDVGDVRNIASETSWHARFARRELTDFPCLPGLAFVSTSDAYELDTLGSRYTWIRMARPTLEALRQASLDHEARIVCDWDRAIRDDDPQRHRACMGADRPPRQTDDDRGTGRNQTRPSSDSPYRRSRLASPASLLHCAASMAMLRPCPARPAQRWTACWRLCSPMRP